MRKWTAVGLLASVVVFGGCASQPQGTYVGDRDAQGREHGYGVLYRPDGSIRYQGQWRNGERDGYGKSYGCYSVNPFASCQHNYVFFEGRWRDGSPWEGVRWELRDHVRSGVTVHEYGFYRTGAFYQTGTGPTGLSMRDFEELLREVNDYIDSASEER